MNARSHINSVPWMTGVTLTSYHECTRTHQLRTMNDRGHTNSVPWMHAVCRLRQATFIQTNCVHSWYGVGVTPVIHGTELMRFCKVALRSIKIHIKWLWPVNVTLEIIKWRLLVFCWFCDEIPLKWEEKNFRASSLWIGIEWDYSFDPPPKWSVNTFKRRFLYSDRNNPAELQADVAGIEDGDKPVSRLVQQGWRDQYISGQYRGEKHKESRLFYKG